MKPAANQKRDKISYNIFNDLRAEEQELLGDCMTRIMRHVDKNISRAEDPSRVSRMLTVRWLIHKNLQKTDN